ncbi:MAG: tRNA 2-thiouridine(34) synthase MnmA [Nitrospirae bacterium]|nr:tRNA 2-thiouridine(34) synthase MnmA [Nitrospirota bacterium]
MNNGKNIIIAMSGGVDSSVAAYLLKEDGYEVIGLSFELWDRRDAGRVDACCSVETIEIAKSVAEKLGIEHQVVDVRDAFHEKVITNFCDSYISGITPNPCILCNKYIKFDFLLKKAAELGADAVATGHYARIEKDEGGEKFILKKGVDPQKDQSYVLYVMTQQELSKTIFPLGEYKKERIREIAKELGLASAMRAESQEICFVGEGHYADFIRSYAPSTLIRGPILNTDGKVLGKHSGMAFYTLGQRKGLGIQSLTPLYVVEINPKTNSLVVGGREDAMKKTFKVNKLNWILRPVLNEPLRADVKVRSTMKGAPALIIPNKDKVLIEFAEPQWAPAPGQSAVFYDRDRVIGGGMIVR